jgi:outer membrane protein assembly factor BamB
MLKQLGGSFLLLALFLGCSSKEYFKPEDTVGSIDLTQRFDASIVEMSGDGASYEDGSVVTQQGRIDVRLPAEYRYAYQTDTWRLGIKAGGDVLAVKNENESRRLHLSKTIASLALKDDLLAVVFADNELALYEFSTGKLIFKEPASESTAVDIRIVTPRFLNDLVLFPTLDGKLVIVNAQSKELLRTIIVSSEQYFNNIIYFNIVNDVLYAATPSKMYALGAKERRIEIEVRNMVVNKDGVWAATKQGEIIAYDHELNEIKKEKFAFAHFLGLIVNDDALYAAEKEEYIIVCKKDISECQVYDFDLEDGYFFSSEDGFYYDNVYIRVQ